MGRHPEEFDVLVGQLDVTCCAPELAPPNEFDLPSVVGKPIVRLSFCLGLLGDIAYH